MHAIKLLHKLLYRSCPQIHQVRLRTLMTSVESLLQGRQLSLTGLGRSLCSTAKVKHNIKRIDRLLGNRHLHMERVSLYQALVKNVVRDEKRPVIIVDWSDLSEDRHWQLLRAAIPAGGRALPLYEEVHPLPQYDSPVVRQQFLERLRELLPEGCCPILVTDAGFRTTWFKQVNALGWDWVGRVRGRTHYRLVAETKWQPCRTLYGRATTRPHRVGSVLLTESNPLNCEMLIVRKRPQGRVKLTRRGTRSRGGQSLACEQRQREPWLLVTSLKGWPLKAIVHLYRLRMQIEEGFRDMKNARLGFFQRCARSRDAHRWAILILISSLALYAAWLMGKAVERCGLHRQFQANTIRHRRVLSTIYLGLQSLHRKEIHFTMADIQQSIVDLRYAIKGQCYA